MHACSIALPPTQKDVTPPVAGLQTQFSFMLPKGFVDESGVLHRHGTMRLATARDEIEPLRSREIDGPDDPYLTLLVLGRVITELGTLEAVGPSVVEQLFAADLAFLQDLYGIINFGDPSDVAALQATVAPEAATVVEAPTVSAEPTVTEAAVVEVAPDDRLDEVAPVPTPSPRARARIEEVPRSSAP